MTNGFGVTNHARAEVIPGDMETRLEEYGLLPTCVQLHEPAGKKAAEDVT